MERGLSARRVGRQKERRDWEHSAPRLKTGPSGPLALRAHATARAAGSIGFILCALSKVSVRRVCSTHESKDVRYQPAEQDTEDDRR